MNVELTPEERAARREALAKVAETQQVFWDALAEFERLTNCEINSQNDFVDFTEPTDEDVESVIKDFHD